MCETMPELSERQKTLLILIIRHYIESARPVGSKQLVDDYRLRLSPATIRNEMVALTEMGYLRQPHTSAGRIPTEKAFRAFVSSLTVNRMSGETERLSNELRLLETIPERVERSSFVLVELNKLRLSHDDYPQTKRAELLSRAPPVCCPASGTLGMGINIP